MIQKLSLLLKALRVLNLPHIYDYASKQPSFRLFCAYFSFLLAAGSVVALHFFPIATATWTAIGFFALCMVFYMLKRLVKAKIDLNDQSLELDSEEEIEKKD